MRKDPNDTRRLLEALEHDLGPEIVFALAGARFRRDEEEQFRKDREEDGDPIASLDEHLTEAETERGAFGVTIVEHPAFLHAFGIPGFAE